MSNDGKGRRGLRGRLVEPYLQVRFGLKFLLLNLVFAGLILLVFGYFFLDVYQTLAGYFQLSADQGAQILEKFHFPLYCGFGLVIAFVFATLALSVHSTHAIYGPLVSIHRFLDNLLNSGNFAPLALRESDQLVELADRLNQLGRRMTEGSGSGDDPEELGQALDRLKDALTTGSLLPADIPWASIETKYKNLESLVNSQRSS